jgi:secondary thiamine-phosphate synthase enzyme
MRQITDEIAVSTKPRAMLEITGPVTGWLADNKATEGLLTLFIRHTSASLTIQENADPAVQADLVDALDALAPETAPYRHAQEGPDDMPAHIKSAITSISLQIPVRHRVLQLGTWQGIFVIEHRARRHARKIALHYCGE